MIDTLLIRDLIPESLIRNRIRRLLAQRLREEYAIKAAKEDYRSFIKKALSSGPVAIHTNKANEQHYELPARFYELVLGSHLKYSSGHWKNAKDLSSAEEEMLELTCRRANIIDGMEILELGCGWGSLTLYLARKYPSSKITAVSNSHSQAEFINTKASEERLNNIKVITSDINVLEMEKQFDRIISVEMFEHMRNYELLLAKVSSWMKPDAKLFIHIFTHKELAYKFDVVDDTDWMAKYFFSGGIMPSHWLLDEFKHLLKIEESWLNSGIHYSKTAEAWLENLKKNRQEILKLFRTVYPGNELKWFVYWKIFFMSCAELWRYNKGEEWIVSHYLLRK